MIKRTSISSKDLIEDITPAINEATVEVIEVYCSHFGCGYKLSPLEKLYTDRCPEHNKKKPVTFFDGRL